MNRLLCFGYGYTARALAAQLPRGWKIIGTSRDGEAGLLRFDRDHPLPPDAFGGVTHILLSIPPDAAGDPVAMMHGQDLGRPPTPTRPSPACGGGSGWGQLRWLGYLSTTGVYGDRGGGWVDEHTELLPSGVRGRRRVGAEQAWLELWRRHRVPVHIFRLAGIYGPRRSPFDALRTGTVKRIAKPDHRFSRIHVEDLASVLLASMARPRPGAIYNVCDDEPAEPAAVVAEAARLIGVAPPPPVPFAEAELSAMARSFWADHKRVSNRLIKQELGIVLRYPTYREGLAAILAAGG